jgi:hypothetical protein
MTYMIRATAATQTISFPNTIATAKLNPTYCGANSFLFSPTKTFLSVSGNTISVSTSNSADVGTHIITLTVSLADYPSVTSISRTFTITVQSDCINTVITNKTLINMSNKVSLAAVTQDISFLDLIATSRSNPTYCGARTYTLSPTRTFLTVSGSTLSL